MENVKILKGDLVGGVISAIIAIPLALAFGVASGLGPSAGLYGALILCFVGTIFGGAPAQISGPTGPVTVIIATSMLLFKDNPQDIFIVILLAGIFQAIISLTKVTHVVKYVPYPVISGFMSGIGAIIILLQLHPLLGLEIKSNPLQAISDFSTLIEYQHNPTALLAIITIAIMFFTPKIISKFIPTALIAILAGTWVSVHYGLDVKMIGEISAKLPSFIAPDFHNIHNYIPLALTLAVISSVESLLTVLVIDSVTKQQNAPNRVLFAQGIGNAISGAFGGLMGSAAAMRTVLNINAGGKTIISSLVHCGVLLAVILDAGQYLEYIPMTVLAGILIKVGYDIIDFKLLNVIRYAPKSDLVVLTLVFFLTVFYDLIFAVGSGITLASLLFAKRVADQTSVGVKDVYDKEIRQLESKIEQDTQHKIRVVHIEGQFFFGSTSQIISWFDELWGTKYLILNYESDSTLDISAIFALEDIIVRLQSQRIRVLLVIKNKVIEEQLRDLKIIQQIGPRHIFYDEIQAINKAKEYLRRNIKSHRKRLRRKKLKF